ncbi:MAG: hypothetical protein ACTS2F_11740 [Thainema sp.]
MSEQDNNSKKTNKLGLALGLGCGIPLGLIVLLFTGAIVYFSMGPEGGVRLANNMEDYALEYIDDQNLLTDNEKVIAYYDATISLNGSEAAILTDSRLIYHKSDRNTEMALADIKSIDTESDGIGGNIIQVESVNGDLMVIQIAAFNQGDLFIKALQTKIANE